MMELWGLILVIIGAVGGYLLTKYGYSKYRVTLELVIKALEDGKITEDEAKAIIQSLLENWNK